MKSSARGTTTSSVEVVNISPHGIWLWVNGKEFFLSYEDFPWFKDASLANIYRVQLIHGRALRWEALDVDVALESLEHSDRYPLTYQ